MHRFPVRIYYEDTDFSGNVYHAAYLKFFERARTEWLRDKGLHHSILFGEGKGFVVTDIEVGYKRPAKIDDLLEVRTHPLSTSGARLIVEQSIWREEELITLAKVTVVLVNDAGRPLRLPSVLKGFD